MFHDGREGGGRSGRSLDDQGKGVLRVRVGSTWERRRVANPEAGGKGRG